MDFNLGRVVYEVNITDGNGVVYDVSALTTDLSWEEQAKELAVRANITVCNTSINDVYLTSIIGLNCQVIISVLLDGMKTVVFHGFIWDWNYDSAVCKQLSLVAYDPLIRLQQSKDYRYFSAGLDTAAIIGSVCQPWDIPLQYDWISIVHQKKVFKSRPISEMITTLLDEVRKQHGGMYIIRYDSGVMRVLPYGTNDTVYAFSSANVMSVSDKLTLSKLVTRVKIIGKEDKDENAPVEAVLDGRTEFGVLQDIITRKSDESLDDARKEALTILDECGVPTETIQLTAPDLPFLRKGDKVRIDAGNLIGFFFVSGISHDAKSLTMRMDLERMEAITASTASDNAVSADVGEFQKGDSVVLNGAVYADSYGNRRGKTFSNYVSSITIVADRSRKCPYHIGAVGWVEAASIGRAD